MPFLFSILLQLLVALFAAPAALAAPPQAGPRPDHVPDSACLVCHADQARLWQGSKHAHAMQPASPANVLGDFSNVRHAEAGESARFYRQGGRDFVETADAGGKIRSFPVEYTFGIWPLQQVLLPLPGGRLQAFTTAWDVANKRWFSLHPDAPIPPGSNLHWSGRFQNWNMMCGECHTTAYRKGYDDARDSYATTWAESEVGCQACHGGGLAHVSSARALAAAGKAGAQTPVPTLNRALLAGGPAQVDQCAYCHGRRTRLVEQAPAGAPLLDSFMPDNLRAELYYADGQQKAEVFEYGSFRQSRMYQAGVTCSDCHEPHSGKLRAQDNALCVRCHNPTPDTARFPGLQAKNYDSPAHHFHQGGSTASHCVECHMPATNYMVIHARRDHAIRIPRPDLTQKIGTPNACQHCHADKSAEWAQAAIVKQHGARRYPPHYGEVLAAARDGAPDSASGLAALIKDYAIPAIVRATALEDWGRIDAGPPPAASLADTDPVVRASAAAALAVRPREERLALLPPLLADPVRAVRITAARGLADIPPGQFDAPRAKQLAAALAEQRSAQEAMADMPSAQLNLATLAQAQGKLDEAEIHYKRALEREPALQPARLAYAALLANTSRQTEAAAVLRDGLAASPQPGMLHLALGLLAGQQHQWQSAATELREAVRLMPDNVQARRNLDAVERYLQRTGANPEQ